MRVLDCRREAAVHEGRPRRARAQRHARPPARPHLPHPDFELAKRVVADHLADMLFCPSDTAVAHLRAGKAGPVKKGDLPDRG